jgi:uncharacterized protein (TIGR02145 family)
LYRDGVAVDGVALEGNGNAATFTGSFNVAGDYTAWTIADDKYCAIAMSGTHVVVENPLPANPVSGGALRKCSGTVTLSASSDGAVIDWYADAAATTALHTGASYTTPEIGENTTYYVQARNESTGCLSKRESVLATVDIEGCCNAPGSTVTFAEFDPCANAAMGTVWYLIDTRESDNIQMYKVKKMADGHIWMVRDLKFGNVCPITWNKTPTANDKVSNSANYYGSCAVPPASSTTLPEGRVYDWAASVNNPNTAYGSATYKGCSGTVTGTCSTCPSTCRGVCPSGWHVPTGNIGGEFATLYDLLSVKECTDETCWLGEWEGGPGGRTGNGQNDFYPAYVEYWTSTGYDSGHSYRLRLAPSYISTTTCDGDADVDFGRAIRCVMNY